MERERYMCNPRLGKAAPEVEREPRRWKGSPRHEKEALDLEMEPSMWNGSPRLGGGTSGMERES